TFAYDKLSMLGAKSSSTTHNQGSSMDLAQRFRQLRHRAGLTATALAAPRYSASLVSRIESGARKPSREALAFFASRLAVTPEFLATGVPQGLDQRLRYRLEQARRDLSEGREEQAEKTAIAVLAEAERYRLASIADLARVVHGEAALARGHLADAIDAF